MAHRFINHSPPDNNNDEPSHVAQQSRRDKLRIQPTNLSQSNLNILDFTSPPPPPPPPPQPQTNDWMMIPYNTDFLYHTTPLQEIMTSLPPPPPTHWLDDSQSTPQQQQQQLQSYHSNRNLSLSLAAVDPQPVGPLGPFTGYATILKGSKFLKPAQQLLDEFCSVVTGTTSSSSRTMWESRNSSDSVNVSSTSSMFGSMEVGSCGGGGGDGVGTDIQQKKVKLIYLQEEVCRRYKQYHQQMQMVVSSFETVAGLSAATPYTSLAVKSVSKHFRYLKNAISDQLRQLSKLLGEEIISSPSSSSRGETMMTTPRLKYLDQGIRKPRGSDGNSSLGFLDNNQPVWRPQRGLPERAVAVLRAWLFEHFLHPYPTDTDKHMLATQTGLSRNQVSNWFINARVRLWKPMVEEIHNLESKTTTTTTETNLDTSNKNEGKSIMDEDAPHHHPYTDHHYLSESHSNAHLANEATNAEISMQQQWHREKRTRMDHDECAIQQGMDGGLMSFAYQGGIDLGGLGAVSLTLGLRHNEDQQQQQQQMRHFGSHMLHDFVG